MNELIFLTMGKGGEHHNVPLIDIDWTVLIQLAIFLALGVILNKCLFQPYLAMRRDQHDNIEGAREKAVAEKQEAEEKLASYEEKLVSARREAAGGRDKLRQEGLDAARTQLDRAKADAAARIEAARKKLSEKVPAVEAELKVKAELLAKSIASNVLGRSV